MNENYGRELMELFGLGVTDAAGRPNYTETDVREAARAASGLADRRREPRRGARLTSTAARWDDGAKTVLGRTGPFGHRELVNVVLAHPSHAPFLVTKLWHEFVPTPPDAATLRDLTGVYRRNRNRIRPLLRRILTHPRDARRRSASRT